MFKTVSSAIACVLALSLFSTATASPLPAVTDAYQGDYKATSVNTNSNLHTIWLPGLLSDAYWQFDTHGIFDYAGTTATLTGTISNNSNTAKKFSINMVFEFIGRGLAGVGSGGPKCGGSCTHADNFEYFSMTSATLIGAGAFAGLDLSATQHPGDGSIPPQLGWGANDKDGSEFGFSTWFDWSVTANNGHNILNKGGRGDVNLELLAAVPLPAGGLLLLTALGGLGLARRRRKAA